MAQKLEVVIGAQDQFSATFGKLKTAIGAAVTAFVSYQAVQSFANALKNVADNADKFSKLQDRLGFTTETLSRLSYAAQLADVDFDSMATSMQFMLKNTSEAARGNEQLQETISRLGLRLSELQRMAPDDMFAAYAEAIAGIQNPAERANIAMEVFGRGGAVMIQMLKDGKDGLQKMSDEAERFGVVISQQAAYNAAEFNDSLTRTGAAISGVKNALLQDLLPYFTSAFNTLASYIADNRKRIVDWAISFIESTSKAAMAFSAFVARVVDGYNAIKRAAAEQAFDQNRVQINSLTETAFRYQKQAEDINKRIAEMEQRHSDLAGSSAYDSLKNRAALLSMQIEAIKNRVFDLNKNNQELAEGFSTAFNEKEVEDFFNRIKSGLEDIRQQGTAEIKPLAMSGEIGGGKGMASSLKSDLDNLRKIWADYMLSESEQIDYWYRDQQSKFAGHKDALVMIEDIYRGKVAKFLGEVSSEYDTYYKTEEQRVEKWYQDQQAKFAGHKDALLKIEGIYQAKLLEISDQEKEKVSSALKSIEAEYQNLDNKRDENRVSEVAKVEIWYQKQLEMYGAYEEARIALENVYREKRRLAVEEDTEYAIDMENRKVNIIGDMMGGLAALSAQMGKKMFLVSKALNIGQAIMSTYTGAANALRDVAYPYNIIAAAAVIAFGMAQVAQIAKQKPPGAKTGLDFVPRDEVWQLHSGERVVQPQANKDLTEFLSDQRTKQQSGVDGTSIMSLTVSKLKIEFPNIRSMDEMRRMSDREWQDLIEERMLPNFRRLARAGIAL